MSKVMARYIYRIDGAKWEIQKVRNGKWALYRIYRDHSADAYGYFRSKRQACQFILGIIPEGE